MSMDQFDLLRRLRNPFPTAQAMFPRLGMPPTPPAMAQGGLNYQPQMQVPPPALPLPTPEGGIDRLAPRMAASRSLPMPTMPQAAPRPAFTPQQMPQMPVQDGRQMRRAGEGAMIASVLGALFGGAQGGAAAGQGYLSGAQQGMEMQRQNAQDRWRADAARVQEANDQGYRAESLRREDQRMADARENAEEARRMAREAAALRLREFDWQVEQANLAEVRRQVEEATKRGDVERARNLEARQAEINQLLKQRDSYEKTATSPIDPDLPPEARKAAAEAVRGIDRVLRQMGYSAPLAAVPDAMLGLPQINPVQAAEEARKNEGLKLDKGRFELEGKRLGETVRSNRVQERQGDARIGIAAASEARQSAKDAREATAGGGKPMTPAQRATQERLIRTDIVKIDEEIAKVRQEIAGFDMVMNKRGAKPEQVNAYKAMRQASENRLNLLSAQREQKRQMIINLPGGGR